MIKTKGIVFRSMKYRETSLIVDIFTEELGMRSYIVNGARKPKSKLPSSLFQAMNLLDLVVYDHKDASKFNRLSECKIMKVYENLPFDVIRSMIGQCMLEVSNKCVKLVDDPKQVYTFLENWYIFLDKTEASISNVLLLFLIEFAEVMGFGITIHEVENESCYFDLEEGQIVPEEPIHQAFLSNQETQILYTLIQTTRYDAHLVPMTNQDRARLIDQLIRFYQYHVDRFNSLKSLSILRSILY